MLIIFIGINSINAENTTDILNQENISVKSFNDLSGQINSVNQTISLDNDYMVDNVTDNKFTNGVKISKNLTINGNSHSIDGNGQAKGLYVKSNCSVILQNLTFKNCFSQSRGGAIYLASNSSLTLKNCFFINNEVYNSNGAAICAQSSTNIDIFNCTFANNKASRVSDLEWSKFKRGMGSALCVGIDSTVKLSDSIFKNNNAYLATVLIISYNDLKYQLSKLLVDNCLFDGNTAKTNTAIYMDEMGQAEIRNSNFINNHATYSGGIICLEASKNTIVENCKFNSNSAVKGGAIYIIPFNDAQSEVSIFNCNFNGNGASENGGAIYANNARLTISDSTFTKNNAPGKGGAIFTYKGSVHISDSNFNSNGALSGGAAYLLSNEIKTINDVFNKNYATKKGGALYSDKSNVYSLNNEYISNNAEKGGDVFGVFDVKVTQTSKYYGCVKLSLKFTSPWSSTLAQNIKLKFIGSKTYKTGWFKVSSNGILNLKVPLDLKTGSYSLEITSDSGICNCKPNKITVIKSKAKIIAKKTTAHYKSGKIFKIKVKNAKSDDYLRGVKLKVKVKQGSSKNTFTTTTGSDGVANVDLSKFNIGKYEIELSSADKSVKISKKVKTKVTVKKGTCSVVASKSVKKYEKIEVKVLTKISKKPIKKFKVFIKTPKKTLKVKTNSKGIIKISTVKLPKGNNRFELKLNNNKYQINKHFTVKII